MKLNNYLFLYNIGIYKYILFYSDHKNTFYLIIFIFVLLFIIYTFIVFFRLNANQINTKMDNTG